MTEAPRSLPPRRLLLWLDGNACLLRYAEFLQFQKEAPVLPRIKIVPEGFSPTQPNYLRFVSTPTIDIAPKYF